MMEVYGDVVASLGADLSKRLNNTRSAEGFPGASKTR